MIAVMGPGVASPPWPTDGLSTDGCIQSPHAAMGELPICEFCAAWHGGLCCKACSWMEDEAGS